MKVLNIVGARPNFIKISPIIKEMSRSKQVDCSLLHTGQHYDSNMNQVFFDQLQIPKPDHNLGVGSGSIPWQISEIIRKFEPVLDVEKPDAILVVGDVNSTIACAIVASYKKIPVIHVEAGLRSYDRNMPEEINRVLTDQISDLLFTTERRAEENLRGEGIPSNKIHFVGNVMVDSLLHFSPVAEKKADDIFDRLMIKHKEYALLTLHRPSNVEDFDTLQSILDAISELSRDIKVVFPMHPRTKDKIEQFELSHLLESVVEVPPMPYLDTICLMNHSSMVLTDSGGMQEETTVLGVPCLTLRDNTERPITMAQGTSTLVGSDKQKILQQARKILNSDNESKRNVPEFWDGCAAKRIVDVLSVHSFV
jgi:UDP-N-acetylglucosamine 2-epimerase (non-hydrolysing)